MRIEDFVEVLKKGVYVDKRTLRVYKRKKGRFIEEEDVWIEWGDKHLFCAKVFAGRGPYYRPWVELFCVDRRFFGSSAERFVYRLIHDNMPWGGRIFVEYWEDRETLDFLAKGGNPEDSRMGKLLIEAGFRGLRDWYIPEGLREGFYKLQGEKL